MTVTVSCVDVGQGDCTVAIDEETSEGLIVDCPGGRHGAAIDELDRLGVDHVVAAYVTHSHLDHFGGVLDALEALSDRFTGTLAFNQDSLASRPVAGPERKEAGVKLRALINRAREYGHRVERAEVGAIQPRAIGALSITLLAPTYEDVLAALADADPNRASAVALLEAGNDCVVVGGDAPLVVWERIEQHIPRRAVVRWPHHGGDIGPHPSAHARLRALLDPVVVLVSVGASNQHGHPRDEFFAANGGVPGCLLCTQATATCAAGTGTSSCAGTIRVRMGGVGGPVVSTERSNHPHFVAGLPTPQCLAAP